MDLIIRPLDHHVLTPHVYPEWFKEDDWRRQFFTIFVFLNVMPTLVYFSLAGLSYVFLFDKNIKYHPQFKPNQVSTEIYLTLKAIPWMALYTTPFMVGEMRGHSKLYDSLDEVTTKEYAMQIALFFVLADFMVYGMHRALHTKLLYARFHKTHHWPIVPTPFAAYAFEPEDGFLQSLPYHLHVFVFPMHRLTFLVCFTFLSLWTVFIHDHAFLLPEFMDPFVNGAAHHSDHHLYFNYNHGLFSTLPDRLFGTYRIPKYEPVVTIRKMEAEGKIPKRGDVVLEKKLE